MSSNEGNPVEEVEELKAQLRITRQNLDCATERAEREKQRADDEAAKREEEKKRAEREKQRADDEAAKREEEKKRAEREKQRADDEAAKREEEKKRAEREKQRADDEAAKREEEKQRAEREKQRADDEAAKREEEKQRADDEIKKNQRTVFFELLQNVHTFIPPLLNVETDLKKAAGGQVSNPDGKAYPEFLKLWNEFPQLHRSTFDTLTTVFGDKQLFPSHRETLFLANTLSPHKRRTEDDIRPYIRAYLELSSAEIVNKYLEATDAPHRFRFGNSSRGSSQWLSSNNSLTPSVSQTSNVSSSSRSTKRKYERLTEMTPDRWGVQTVDDKPRGIIIGEYKAAHKLPNTYLRNVLGTPNALPAESLVRDYATRSNLATETTRNAPDNPDASTTPDRQSKKEQLSVCQVICQTYHYMILYGIQYAYITSGVGSVLLKVSPAEPAALYYHYIDHNIPATPISSPGNDLVHTPPAQLVTLILEALAIEPTSDENNVFGKIYDYPAWSTPRSKLRKPSSPTTIQRGDPPYDDEDDNGSGNGGGTGTSTHGSSGRGFPTLLGPGAASSTDSTSSTQHRSRAPRNEYCTQTCLLGLTRGGVLDPRCPNVLEHVRTGGSKSVRGPGGEEQQYHAITAAELCTMLVAQQTQCHHDGVKSLFFHGLHGAVGTLFKLTLLKHGYTFVGKGVGDEKRSRLDYEASIYTHPTIQPLQGDVIPVYLGTIELEEYPFLVINGVAVWHLLLMSWAGDSLAVKRPPPMQDWRWYEVLYGIERFCKKLAARGLGHGDLRLPNFAWSAERGHLMAIDFDRSVVLDDEGMEEAALYADSPEQSSEGSPQPIQEDAESVTRDGLSVDVPEPDPTTAVMMPGSTESMDTGLSLKRSAHDAGLSDESRCSFVGRDTKRYRIHVSGDCH